MSLRRNMFIPLWLHTKPAAPPPAVSLKRRAPAPPLPLVTPLPPPSLPPPSLSPPPSPQHHLLPRTTLRRSTHLRRPKSSPSLSRPPSYAPAERYPRTSPHPPSYAPVEDLIEELLDELAYLPLSRPSSPPLPAYAARRQSRPVSIDLALLPAYRAHGNETWAPVVAYGRAPWV
jgi:hypothetical protein